jgi:hypothetical protein
MEKHALIIKTKPYIMSAKSPTFSRCASFPTIFSGSIAEHSRLTHYTALQSLNNAPTHI